MYLLYKFRLHRPEIRGREEKSLIHQGSTKQFLRNPKEHWFSLLPQNCNCEFLGLKHLRTKYSQVNTLEVNVFIPTLFIGYKIIIDNSVYVAFKPLLKTFLSYSNFKF